MGVSALYAALGTCLSEFLSSCEQNQPLLFPLLQQDDENSVEFTPFVPFVYEPFSNYFLPFALDDHSFEPSYLKNLLEAALRKQLIVMLSSKVSIRQVLFLMDLALHLESTEKIDTNGPYVLLSDWAEMQNTERAILVFEFMEKRLDFVKKDLMPQKTKGLSLLRMGNDILRRLSRANNSFQCGKILLFMSRLFPLCTRSGVNLMGNFNVDNVTVYEGMPVPTVEDEQEEEQKDESKDEMEVEKEESESVQVQKSATETPSTPKNPFDVLYETFWSLQSHFNYPGRCLADDAEWESFTNAVEATINYFERNPIDEAALTRKTKTGDDMELDLISTGGVIPSSGSSVDGNFFYPKYLTSKKLFAIQLKDAYFRRQILFQILIYLQCLALFSPNSNLPAPMKQGSGTGQMLKEDQESWVMDRKRYILKLLEKTHYKGRLLYLTTKRLLMHEIVWIKWKANSCQNFERDPEALASSFDPLAEITAKDYDEMSMNAIETLILKGQRLGNDELDRLWRSAVPSPTGNTNADESNQLWLNLLSSDNTSDLSQNANNQMFKVPKPAEFFAPLIEEMLPENDIEKAYRLSAQPTYVWKAIRILMCANVNLAEGGGAPDIEAVLAFNDSKKKKPVSSSRGPSPSPST